MNLLVRIKIYTIITIVYILFLLNSSYDIWPWGAIVLGVPMIIAEILTWISLRKRNR